MSRIEELIAELCPRGVQRKTLGEVTKNFDRFRRPVTRASRIAGPYPYYGANGVQDHVNDYLFDGTYLLVGEDGSVTNTDGSPIINWASGRIWVNNHAHVLQAATEDTDLRYLFFYLKTLDISSFVSSGTQPKLNQRNLNRILVAVPPLEVQREIVRALDQFTQLEAELEAELEARRRQYEHYRHGLLALSASDETRWTTLGDISRKVSSGGTPSSGREAYYGGEIPWLRTQEVDFGLVHSTGMTITAEGLLNSSAKWIPTHCVIVAMYGATAAKVAINEIPLTTNQACCNLQIDPSQAEYRYVFHWVSNEYERLKGLGEGSQSNLNARKVKNYPIPIPPLEEQRRIVTILDKFDTLANDLSVGLPAELNARQKQYEYYRDRLLTFDEAAA